jgi:hypothetical protein
MKREALILVGLLCLAGIVCAQVSEHYDLSWHVIGGGGSAMDSASYVMRSTVGQLIGLSSSENYQVGAGYWYGNVSVSPPQEVFYTGPGTYPSIAGTHNGTITPDSEITASQLYVYSCAGTGGHAEYVKIWKGTETIAEENWDGYQGDWQSITFAAPVTLEAHETYNYTIRTGSYPQIIHAGSKEVTGGTITCTSFVDANGKEYADWIPAIRLN